jgi:probable rRNA maturation factor
MNDRIRLSFQKKSRLPNEREKLKSFIVSIFKKEKTPLSEMRFVFCSDEFLHEINRTHLKHDDLTDVITFVYSKSGDPVQSEAYISLDRVFENAGIYKTTKSRELHRVVFHSVLHVCGYNDKKPAQKTTMRAREDHYLNLYFR